MEKTLFNAKTINTFLIPFERWSERELNFEEALAFLKTHGFCRHYQRDKLLKTITSPIEAAKHMAENLVDNCLESFIDEALSNSMELAELRKQMPSTTPPGLEDYKYSYPTYDPEMVNEEIQTFGVALAEGQSLFHGGCWPAGLNHLITDRPLSTTFCPQIARRSAEQYGKAYNESRLDIIVFTVRAPKTKAYLYGTDGHLAHEKEIVFARGAELKMISETYICDSYVFKTESNLMERKKLVPTYVIEADIS